MAPFGPDAARAISEKLPPGITVAEVRELAPEERALSKAVKSARYTVRLDPEYFHRATGALASGWREAVPALRTLALEGDEQDGHSYRVEAVLETEKLQRYDLAVDFPQAKRALEEVAKELDYTYINEHPAFVGRNTSAENLARFFAERLEASRDLGWARVVLIVVCEGPENRTYRPKGRMDDTAY